MAKYGKKAQDKVEKVMHEMKEGKLKSGTSNKKVTSRKQAIAIGLSEARKAGGKVPAKASPAKAKAKTASKSSAKSAAKSTAKSTTAKKTVASGRQLSKSATAKAAPKRKAMAMKKGVAVKAGKKDESMISQATEAMEHGAKAVMDAAMGMLDFVEEGLGIKKPAKKKKK